MSNIAVKRGDVGVVFRYTILLDRPRDFYDSVPFWKLRNLDTGTEITHECSVVMPATYSRPRRTLLIEYTTVDGDFAVSGKYSMEWEIVWGDGARMTFPRDTNAYLLVYQSVENPLSVVLLQTEGGDGTLITTEDGRPFWIIQ